MDHEINAIEKRRLFLQAELDQLKTQVERNRLGQFATPTALAVDILSYASHLHPKGKKVRFLDPAIGTGAFYSALQRVFPKITIAEALGFEIDPHYKKPASELWAKDGLVIKLADFTVENPSPRFNLVICNPPYVRHQHLKKSEKARLQNRVLSMSGVKIGGLSGLYCYFLGIAHAWMAEDGLAGWLVPSEFMDVNYGQVVKRYLLDKVTLLRIHRFDPNDVQFADALVSSTVIWLRKAPPTKEHAVMFTYGGTLLNPKVTRIVPSIALAHEPKWTRFPAADVRTRSSEPTLSSFFQIKRGIATGDNSFFILSEEDIRARKLPMEVFRPILPSPRYLLDDEVKCDHDGIPENSRRLFLLDTRFSETEIKTRYPALHTYLEEGKARGLHQRYLCRHRTPWYAQENRPSAPLVCTYLGRGDTRNGRPFRFILNYSKATVANVYLALYPTTQLKTAIVRDPALLRRVAEALNTIPPEQLLGEGRVYGGGLHKLEPKELANVDATSISRLLRDIEKPISYEQMDVFEAGEKLPVKNELQRARLPARR